jgi:hypothetical protein
MQSDCLVGESSVPNNNATSTSTSQNGFSRTPPDEMVRNFGFGLGAQALHRLITTGYGTLPVGDTFFDNQNMFPFNMVPRDDVVARGPPSNNSRQREPRRERIPRVVDNRVMNDGPGFVKHDNRENDELMAALLACEDGGVKNPLPGIISSNINHDMHFEDHDPGML